MTDIVERLRNFTCRGACHHASCRMEREAAAEIERLRSAPAGKMAITFGDQYKIVGKQDLLALAGPIKGPPEIERRVAQLIREAWNKLPATPAWYAFSASKPEAGRDEVIEEPAVLQALEDGFVSGYNAAQNDACRTIRAMVPRTLKSTPSDAGRAGCAATAGSEPGHTPDSLAAMEKGNG